MLLQPIESPTTGVGILDLYFRTEKCGGWIELKVGHVSATGEVKIKWQPGQLSWIKRHVALSGKTFLFVGVEPNRLMILHMTEVCEAYAHVNPLTESANFIGTMSSISGDKLMRLLNL